MGEIDLNAGRAARAEGKAEPIKVVLGAGEWTLGLELPTDMFRKILGDPELAQLISGEKGEDERLGPAAVMNLVDAVETIFTPEQLAEFRAERPSTADYVALAAGLLGGTGKSDGSGSSSGTGTKRKRTSKPSTGSTSSGPATGPVDSPPAGS